MKATLIILAVLAVSAAAQELVGQCSNEGEACDFGDFRCCEELLCHEYKCMSFHKLPETRSFPGKGCGGKGDKCMTQADCCENKFWCRKSQNEAYGRCEYYL